jgi:hypothetical protein
VDRAAYHARAGPRSRIASVIEERICRLRKIIRLVFVRREVARDAELPAVAQSASRDGHQPLSAIQ